MIKYGTFTYLQLPDLLQPLLFSLFLNKVKLAKINRAPFYWCSVSDNISRNKTFNFSTSIPFPFSIPFTYS
ncbi:DUF3965 domain-containing protein [Bacillus bingmayongensis]|uniref:DUF3965 domain-containing protein n=1 Tax=Bacillus bingmayongensis TaxID=1150157 RepID=UPI0035ABCF39